MIWRPRHGSPRDVASPNRWPPRGSVVVENDGLRYGAMGARSARRFPRPIRRHRRKAQNAQTKRAPEPPRRERILLLTKKPPYKGRGEGRGNYDAPHPAASPPHSPARAGEGIGLTRKRSRL